MEKESNSSYERRFLHSLRPEQQIVVLSAKSSLESVEMQTICRLLKGSIDWDFLFRLAIRSGTFPLLFANLESQFSWAASESVVNQFHNRAQMMNAKNLILTNEIRRVIALLQKNDIEPIPYKGPGLAQSIYGNIAMRQFNDLDLLVRHADVPKARSLLLRDAYRPADDIDPMTHSQQKAFLHFHYTYDFHNNELGIRLEMHWGIVPRYFGFPIDYEQLWERATPQSFYGTNILTLSPEDSLLVLCVTGTKHLWNRLSRICDVAETIRCYPGLNWETLLAEAGRLGVQRILLLALYLSKQLLNAPLPQSVCSEVEKDFAVPQLGASLLPHLLGDDRKGSFFQEDAQFQPLYFKARERGIDKFRYLARLVSTPGVGEWRMVTLPGFLYFFYYFIRPIRLAGKYAWKTARQTYQSIMNRFVFSAP